MSQPIFPKRIFLATSQISLLILSPTSAMAQILPPCCETPDVLAEIASRPEGESVSDFLAWLDQRQDRIGTEGWRADVATLYGACAQGCPPRYAIALQNLTSRIAPTVLDELRSSSIARPNLATDGGPQAEEANVTAPAVSRNTARTPSGLDLRLANGLLRRILDWEDSPDNLPGWIRTELRPYRNTELQDLYRYLAGACRPDQVCPSNLVIALQAVEGEVSDRDRRRAAEVRAAERSEDQRIQADSRWVTLLSAVFSAAAAIVAALVSLLGVLHMGRAQDRERSEMRALLRKALHSTALQMRTAKRKGLN